MKIEGLLKEIDGERFCILTFHNDSSIEFIILPEIGAFGEDDLFGEGPRPINLNSETLDNGKTFSIEISKEFKEELESDNTNGFVKWDGCSNWNFSGDNTMTHLCEPEQMDTLTALVRFCYSYTEDNLENYSE